MKTLKKLTFLVVAMLVSATMAFAQKPNIHILATGGTIEAIVAMHYVNVDQHGNISEKETIKIDGVFTGVELQTQQAYWCSGPVPSVYNATFLSKVNYPFTEDVLFEDADYVNVHLYHAKRMMYNPVCSYRVHYNSQSTTHTSSFKHVADYLLLGTRMLRLYHSLEDKTSVYALGILEGGSHNIWKSCKRLIKLSSIAEVKKFYERVDQYTNRSALLSYKEPAYCWTRWTKLCLGHKRITMCFAGIGQTVYKILRRK